MIALVLRLEAAIVRVLEVVVALLMAALVLDVLWQIVTRFMLGNPSNWTVELARYLMMWLAMLGAAVAFARREHLGLDYFSHKLHPDARRTLAVFVQLVTIAFAGWVLLGGGTRLVAEVLATGQLTAALGVPMGAVYLATPIAGACVILSAVADLLELFTSESQDQTVEPSPDNAA